VQRWPTKLWVVRHGESAGNVARDPAHAAGGAVIDIEARDVEVPLSRLGERQAWAPRPLVRVVAAGPTAKRCPLFALPSRPKHRQRSSRRGGARNRLFRTRHRRTVAGKGIRHPRQVDETGHRAAPSRTGRCGDGLGSRTSDPRAAKAGATSSCGSGASSTPSACTMPEARAGRGSSGSGSLHALSAGEHGRSPDPRHRCRGRRGELRGHGSMKWKRFPEVRMH
jgi:hypothetical protein